VVFYFDRIQVISNVNGSVDVQSSNSPCFGCRFPAYQRVWHRRMVLLVLLLYHLALPPLGFRGSISVLVGSSNFGSGSNAIVTAGTTSAASEIVTLDLLC
jgi:hypothetical protein